jgi:hypothetical protein
VLNRVEYRLGHRQKASNVPRTRRNVEVHVEPRRQGSSEPWVCQPGAWVCQPDRERARRGLNRVEWDLRRLGHRPKASNVPRTRRNVKGHVGPRWQGSSEPTSRAHPSRRPGLRGTVFEPAGRAPVGGSRPCGRVCRCNQNSGYPVGGSDRDVHATASRASLLRDNVFASAGGAPSNVLCNVALRVPQCGTLRCRVC